MATFIPSLASLQTQPATSLAEAQKQRLRELATQAAGNSYSPYSRFRVGAALLLADGAIVAGCNVENCSYRLTSCAEQAAIARAVSERGRRYGWLPSRSRTSTAQPPCLAALAGKRSRSSATTGR